MNKHQLRSEERKENLLKSAMYIGECEGLSRVTHTNLAKHHQENFGPCSVGTVFRYFPSAEELTLAVIKETIENGEYPVELSAEVCTALLRFPADKLDRNLIAKAYSLWNPELSEEVSNELKKLQGETV